MVEQFEVTLNNCEQIKENGDHNDFVIEMSKASGLASGIVQEGSLLIADIHSIVKHSGMQPSAKDNDFLAKILDGLKGPNGSTN